MKKLLYSFIMLFVSFSLASCGGDDDESELPNQEQGTDTEISLQEQSITGLVAEGYEKTVYFSAPENWRAVSNCDWITATPTQGTKGSSVQVKVKIAENTSTEERAGELLISTISKNQTFYKISITQKGREVVNNPDDNQNAPAGMTLNAGGLVKEIKVGWNLGNTLEATDEWVDENGKIQLDKNYIEGGANLFTETKWQEVKTKKEMFTVLKTAGFNAVRIPVRWYRHADADMNINSDWMARVKEIVDYAVSQDMYVILNSHHDTWYDRLPVGYNEAEILTKFENMWKQIATAFKDYDEHLIFAGTNEVIKLNSSGGDEWGTPNAADLEMMNKLNQKFVDAVRATGGNNKWRCLMVQPWACSPSNALNSDFKLPTDVVENRLIVEFHCYDPYNYCTQKTQHSVSQTDYNNLSNLFSRMKSNFIEKGIPVIMGEFGSTQDNSDKNKEAEYDKTRAEYLCFVVSEAKKYNIPGFYWDNGVFTGEGENFGLLDRKTCTFPTRAKIALDGIMNGQK